jgi:glycosylphosphatidylinositol phospholipase D
MTTETVRRRRQRSANTSIKAATPPIAIKRTVTRPPISVTAAGVLSAGIACYAPAGGALPFVPVFELSWLNGLNGSVLNGIHANDRSGQSVSGAGDLNDDGFDDIVIGAYLAEVNGEPQAGESYVVFGTSSGIADPFDLSSLDGANGFVLEGAGSYSQSGFRVSDAGDVNGDAIDDLIIGAPYAPAHGVERVGVTYVVFGSTAGFPASIDLSTLNGRNGFKLIGTGQNTGTGLYADGAGDVNGDGVGDLIIGAPFVPSGPGNSGQGYVVFGRSTGFPASLDLSALDGSNGFTVNGSGPFDYLGIASAAGDVNGDGIDDVLIGAPGVANASYVIFGSRSPFPANLAVSTLNGSNGFVLIGVDTYYGTGHRVSDAGDLNGDGFGDIIIAP